MKNSISGILLFFFLMGSLWPSQANADGASRLNAGVRSGVFSAHIGMGRTVEVGVSDPEGKFFFLRTDEFSCPGVIYKNGRIKIDTKYALGVFWTGDRKETDFVFQKPGRYKIVVADNLETELENSYSLSFDLSIGAPGSSSVLEGRKKSVCVWRKSDSRGRR